MLHVLTLSRCCLCSVVFAHHFHTWSTDNLMCVHYTCIAVLETLELCMQCVSSASEEGQQNKNSVKHHFHLKELDRWEDYKNKFLTYRALNIMNGGKKLNQWAPLI